MDALDDPVAWLASRPAGDPVCQRVLQGLARRAAAQRGALRARLVARLVQRAEALLPTAASPAVAPAMARDRTSPLSALLAPLNAGAGAELRNVQAHQATWAALRQGRRLAEVSAPVPEHLGPLNSQVLVARALQQVQGLAPGYLRRLLTQLDTLAGLSALQAPEADSRPRAAARKPARKR